MLHKFSITVAALSLTLTTNWACDDDNLPGNPIVSYLTGTELPAMDDSFVEVSIEPFKFLGTTQNVIYIGDNGVLSFGSPVTYRLKTCDGPLEDNTTKVIAPFWADVNIRQGGKIMYEQVVTYTQDSKYTTWANAVLNKAYGGQYLMYFAFAVSYKNVPYYNKKDSTGAWISPPCPCSGNRNSFDVLLVTDHKESYVLFHYRKLTWYCGTSSGAGATCEGIGGTPAIAGFSIGGPIQLISNQSCTENVMNLASGSNLPDKAILPGVWVFRVDTTLESPSGQL